MSRKNNKTSFYKFIEPYLENGNSEEIERAKKEYRRQYQRKWEQNKRKTSRTFKVSFTASEINLIEKQRDQYSYSQFIKRTCIAFCAKKRIDISTKIINELTAILIRLYQEVSDANESGSLNNTHATLLIGKIEHVENHIHILIEKLNQEEG